MITDYLLIIQILLIVALLLKGYLISFAKEKGKNLATKQDIQEITTKIEEAKIFYNTKLETVKASLQINTHEQNIITQKSLDTLLDFYDVSLILIKDNLSRNFGDTAAENLGPTVLQFQDKTEDLFIKQNVLYHRLLVFLGTEKEIILKASNLVKISQELRKVFKKHFGNIKIALINEAEAIKSTEDIWRHAAQQTNIYSKAYNDESEPIFEILHKNLEEFIEVLISYLKKKEVLQYLHSS